MSDPLNPKVPWNLSVPLEFKRKMKRFALKKGEDVSDLIVATMESAIPELKNPRPSILESLLGEKK